MDSSPAEVFIQCLAEDVFIVLHMHATNWCSSYNLTIGAIPPPAGTNDIFYVGLLKAV
jgi:hypothetical protein